MVHVLRETNRFWSLWRIWIIGLTDDVWNTQLKQKNHLCPGFENEIIFRRSFWPVSKFERFLDKFLLARKNLHISTKSQKSLKYLNLKSEKNLRKILKIYTMYTCLKNYTESGKIRPRFGVSGGSIFSPSANRCFLGNDSNWWLTFSLEPIFCYNFDSYHVDLAQQYFPSKLQPWFCWKMRNVSAIKHYVANLWQHF